MKKFYATLFVAALGAGTMFAQEPEFSTVWVKHYDVEVGAFDPAAPDWNSADAIKTQPGMRNATGVDGKLYGIDMRTMSITEFDKDGYRKAFDLPSLAGQTISYVGIEATGALVSSPDYYGSLITRDDAGNLLVGHGYNTGATATTWTVLDRKTGAAKRLVADLGSNYHACLPVDLISRALGDVTKEGYLYVGPNSIYWTDIKGFPWATDYNKIQRAKILSFKGDGTVDGTSMTGEASDPMLLSAWFYNVTAPWYSTVDAMKAAVNGGVTMSQTFFVYSKLQCESTGTNQWGAQFGILDGAGKLVAPNDMFTTSSDMLGFNFSAYDAFDTFELGGKRYYVAAYNEDSETQYEGIVRFNIFDEEGMALFYGEKGYAWSYDGEWNDEAVKGAGGQSFPSGSMNLNVEKVDDNNVNIYVWAQNEGNGVVAGMFNFGTSGTGVTDVTVEANDAAPVYYNLNGVRVENPANGIFIEKRGNKAVKVVK